MNKQLKIFIIGLVISIACFVTSFFADDAVLFFILVGIGLFALLKYTIPALKKYREEYENKSTATVNEYFISRCRSIINEYEHPLNMGDQSCEQRIIPLVKNTLASHNHKFDNIERQTRTLILNICYSLLSSGEYHIYAATLNPHGIAPSLLKVYEGCAVWLLDNSFLSKEQYEENHRQLKENIESVG